MNKPSILIIEDDKAVKNLIATTLEMHDYHYIWADKGEQGILSAASQRPDIILLDLGLPDMDGVDVILKIRSWTNTPIIVISARSEDSDKIAALDAGADDYLTKPFSVDELLARLRSTQRRLSYMQSLEEVQTSLFANGGLTIDYAAGCACPDRGGTAPPDSEYKLLCLPLPTMWGRSPPPTHNPGKYGAALLPGKGTLWPSLRTFMASLRKKIEKRALTGPVHQTHVGVGYRMMKR